MWLCCIKTSLIEYCVTFVVEAHRALELLEDYHSKLIKPQDKQLRLAIERVIRIFKSRLFQALLGTDPSPSDLWPYSLQFVDMPYSFQ